MMKILDSIAFILLILLGCTAEGEDVALVKVAILAVIDMIYLAIRLLVYEKRENKRADLEYKRELFNIQERLRREGFR